MKPTIILLCAVNMCISPFGCENHIGVINTCALTPGVPKASPEKPDYAAILPPETEKKRRSLKDTRRKNNPMPPQHSFKRKEQTVKKAVLKQCNQKR